MWGLICLLALVTCFVVLLQLKQGFLYLPGGKNFNLKLRARGSSPPPDNSDDDDEWTPLSSAVER